MNGVGDCMKCRAYRIHDRHLRGKPRSPWTFLKTLVEPTPPADSLMFAVDHFNKPSETPKDGLFVDL